MTPRTAVVTIAHGRHEHLEGQLWGLAAQTQQPDVYVAVAMDDPGLAEVVGARALPGWEVHVPRLPAAEGGLPLAAARNAGARAALAVGADVLVFLDVDCIPSPGLVQRYAAVLGGVPGAVPGAVPVAGVGHGPVVACGEVAYLPPVASPAHYRTPGVGRLSRPHPARPVLGAQQVQEADDVRLFWSLSFAITAEDWRSLGGFDEGYCGYGGEDTDFGQRLRAADGTMLWVGGAAAYHQHHDSQTPPVRHRDSIVANANRFQRRWGWFPMEGWLRAFADMGLAELEPASGQWRVLPAPDGASSPVVGGAAVQPP